MFGCHLSLRLQLSQLLQMSQWLQGEIEVEGFGSSTTVSPNDNLEQDPILNTL